jgi:hypothetical protein
VSGRLRNEVVVLGDSHARVFGRQPLRRLPVRFEVVSVSGATASGLANPNSASGASSTFTTKLDQIRRRRRPPKAIVVVLGEVDCGFVIWWHQQERGTPVDELLDRAITNLASLLVQASACAPAVFVSAPLPTIADQAEFGEYANQRRSIIASQAERTELVLEFNRRAAEVCERLGVTFIDLDDRSLGPDGLVSSLLANPDPANHHYDPIIYSRLLANELRDLPAFR